MYTRERERDMLIDWYSYCIFPFGSSLVSLLSGISV